MPLSGLKKETREPAIWAKEPEDVKAGTMKLTKLTCLSPPDNKVQQHVSTLLETSQLEKESKKIGHWGT